MNRLLFVVFVLLLQVSAWGQSLVTPSDIVVRDQEVLVAEFARRELLKLSDSTTIELPVFPWALADSPRGVFVCDPLQSRVGRVDSSGDWHELLELEARAPTGIAFCQGKLYVVEKFGRLLRIDPVSGATKKILAYGLTGAGALRVLGDELFLSLPQQGEVWTVSTKTESVTDVLSGLDLPTGLAVTPEALFVTETATGSVWEYPRARQGRRLVWQGQVGVASVAHSDAGLLVGNLLQNSLHQIDEDEVEARVPARLEGYGSLRFELENRTFLSGFTPLEWSPDRGPVNAPMLAAFFSSYEQFSGVVDAALDNDGQLYYTMTVGGQLVTGWSGRLRVLTVGLEDPAGLALGADGVVYVTEAGAGRLTAVTSGGDRMTLLSNLQEPVDVVSVEQGLLVVDKAAGQLLSVGKGTRVLRDGLQAPTAVCALPDGSLAVIESGRDRVLRLDAEGRELGVLHQGEPGSLTPPRNLYWRVIGGLAVDPVLNRLLICEPASGRIVTVPLSRD